LIASGRNGGTWDGLGIITSQGDARTNLTALGIAGAAELLGLAPGETGYWQGQIVDATSAIIKYTYGGDANLDGKINVDDYGRIDFNVSLGMSGWLNGDFNYDGKINVDDYGIIDFNVGIQGAPISGSIGATPSSSSSSSSSIARPVVLWTNNPSSQDEDEDSLLA
jgi:hypothetical protein